MGPDISARPRLGKGLLFWKLDSYRIPPLPSVLFGLLACYSTFIGIAVHNVTASNSGGFLPIDLAAAIRQDASGLLGTTVLLSDLVCPPFMNYNLLLPVAKCQIGFAVSGVYLRSVVLIDYR